MQPEEFQSIYKISDDTLGQFQRYAALLKKWQGAINLVSNSTIPDLWERHFHDSAQLLQFIPTNCKAVADIGSGGGFPALVLAILRPDINFHLIESDTRKCEFLRSVSRETGVKIHIHNDRAENILSATVPDIVTARAFKPVLEIMDLCAGALPAFRGPFILLKGEKFAQEIDDAAKKFEFSHTAHPSKTSAAARIVIIENIIRRTQ